MAHFIITLPNQQQADVRSGKIRKINLHIRQLLRLRPFKKEENKGYIVKIADAPTAYHLIKTMDGKWLRDGEHYWIHEPREPLNEALRQAIDRYEKQAFLT